jgi:hypothetical protein
MGAELKSGTQLLRAWSSGACAWLDPWLGVRWRTREPRRPDRYWPYSVGELNTMRQVGHADFYCDNNFEKTILTRY